MTSAAQVLAVARSQLGVQEIPHGSNRVIYNDWYYGRPVSGDGYAWCDVFVQWVAAQAGAAALFPRTGYVPFSANAWKALGRFGSVPRIGAQSIYQWPGSGVPTHTGLVESVIDGGIIAIEGNTGPDAIGGMVMRVVRKAYIVGYGYPAYSDAPGPPVPPPGPGQLVVDGVPGPQTYAALQRAVGAPVDGQLGPITWRAIQTRCGSPADGIPGPNTWRAIQRHVGSPADGIPGPNTWRAIQTALNAGRF